VFLGDQRHLLQSVEHHSRARRRAGDRERRVRPPPAEDPELVPHDRKPSFDVTQLRQPAPDGPRSGLLVGGVAAQREAIARHDEAGLHVRQAYRERTGQGHEIRRHGLLCYDWLSAGGGWPLRWVDGYPVYFALSARNSW